ncbi:lysylphosphatidylglycerol synthase domain-containing protein [Piscinibacter sp. XHJ-5]|uniref:lysylphosphatidylglycerol synthase domain-containing protein n=1 Tax=Piscinibacter sp. XHJ-5 TaxID=3037797 RepID=UPI002452A9F3|nr:lysylphosphatidylglycerol synthase domain-containing protein [Piscinibacter sp. XHJ-5]
MSRAGTHPTEVHGTRDPRERAAARPAWRVWAVRILTCAFFALVIYVLARLARTLDWDTVLATLQAYRPGTLAIAAALAACSYCVYAAYELVARRYSGHTLPAALTGMVGSISYSFNLNLGVWLGGIGFRYRLYSQLGVDTPTTARLYLSTLASNWTGYLAVAGAAFAFYGLDLPPQWELSDRGLRWVGVVLMACAAGYLLLCAFAPRRHLTIRGHEFDLPSLRMAAAQMALGATNWMLMAGIVYTLMPHAQPAPGYGTVLATLLLACIAGTATHIPAGLGVLEAVFIALLGHRVPESQLLGALLAYRAVYFIGPLIVAGIAYGWLESRLKRKRS